MFINKKIHDKYKMRVIIYKSNVNSKINEIVTTRSKNSQSSSKETKNIVNLMNYDNQFVE